MEQVKLTKAQREQIIFDHIKGKDNPLYEVSQTKYGKYVVKPKVIELEEEEPEPEPEEEQEEEPEPKPRKVKRKQNDRTKQDAKQIVEELIRVLNTYEQSDDEEPQAPPLIEPTNFNPQPRLTYRRRRLAF